MTEGPVLINHGTEWRLGTAEARRSPRLADRRAVAATIRSMMRRGLDSIQIAKRLHVSEAHVWNSMARAGK